MLLPAEHGEAPFRVSAGRRRTLKEVGAQVSQGAYLIVSRAFKCFMSAGVAEKVLTTVDVYISSGTGKR